MKQTNEHQASNAQLTIAEAAGRYGIKNDTLRKWAKSGKVRATRSSDDGRGVYLIDCASLEAHLHVLKAPPASPAPLGAELNSEAMEPAGALPEENGGHADLAAAALPEPGTKRGRKRRKRNRKQPAAAPPAPPQGDPEIPSGPGADTESVRSEELVKVIQEVAMETLKRAIPNLPKLQSSHSKQTKVRRVKSLLKQLAPNQLREVHFWIMGLLIGDHRGADAKRP